MWQNIVPVTVLQRALRIFLGSLFAATVWVCVSAASSFAADPSALVTDATRIVKDDAPAPLPDGASPVLGVLSGSGLHGILAKGASAVTDVAEHAVAPAAALADVSVTTVEPTTRKLTATATSVVTSGVKTVSKPAAAVVDSVIRQSADVVKPVLTEVVSLPVDVLDGGLPDPAAVPAAPAPAEANPAAEPSPDALPDTARAVRSVPGSERAEQFSGVVFSGVPAPEAAGNLSGTARHTEGPSLPATAPAGVAGSANSGSTSNLQSPAAAIIDIFNVPFQPASELKTRSSGPDPQTLNRNPGFSPD